MQGIWLPKELEKYSDEKFKSEMLNTCRELAETFKDDPNIFCWGIGNEVQLSGANGSAVWSFIEELAVAIKEIAPRQVMIYTIDRETPVQGLQKATPELLDGIAAQVRALGFDVSVSY